jgi:2-polyprenyl-3-methyl-5-hydroxy-6-metoxy-1,4-benzoquinol methylase
MADLSQHPNPDLIYDLYTGVFRPQMARLALQLDVLTPLADGPADAATVARACGCSPAGAVHLLDVLVSAQVLTRQDGRYALTPSAAAFLVRGRPAYAGDLILAWTGPTIWESVQRAVRSGQPAPFEEYHEQDAWLESYSEGRIAYSRKMWQAAGIAPQPDTPRRLLDIACGCAIKSLALAQLDPALHVTCVDTPRVLPAARALAERMGLLGQAAFIEADLLTADLGADLYDACLLGQITHYLTPAQNQDLFRRVHAALRPDGTLVIDVPMTGEQPSTWTEVVSLLLWVNGGGATHTFDEYRAWLQQAGFGAVSRPSERSIAATR